MFDEWANQDFSGLSSEAMVREPVWQDRYDFATPGQGSGTPELPMLDEGVRSGLAIDTGFLTCDDFYDSVAKPFDLEPLSTEDDPLADPPDGGTVDDIVVTGVRQSPPETPLPNVVVPGPLPVTFGDRGNGNQTPPSQLTLPEVLESYLEALRDFVARMSGREEVGDRNANSRFDRDPQHQREIRVGNTTVYWDARTSSFWFDADGPGETPETEFWIFRDGVWYDFNNDGGPDSRVVGF